MSVTFGIASSASLLTSPDIGTGPGVVSAEGAGASNEGARTYTFTAINTDAAPRIVYWDVSYSSSDLPECETFAPTTLTTGAREVIVQPQTAVQPVPSGGGEATGNADQVKAQPVQCVVPALVGKSLPDARRVLRKAHCRLGKVSYHRSRDDRGAWRVVGEQPSRGERLKANSAVAITVSRSGGSHRRRPIRRQR